ncbi:MAG: hypothetical protein D6820_11915, partial [Lentisphaerae bacterium]
MGQIARGGVESAKALTRSGRVINYIARYRTAVKTARAVSRVGLIGNAGSGGYDVGTGINKVAKGDKSGYLDILSGSLRVGGALLGAREREKSLPIEGGKFRDLPNRPVPKGYQRHHIPPTAAYKVDAYKEGPAVLIDTPTHMNTASWGSFRRTRKYREKLLEMMTDGRVTDAVKKDIKNLRSLAGDKYNLGINQMLDYVEELLKNENNP